MDDDALKNPPGYYNTVERPDPGGSLPEPIGPRGRAVSKLVGVGFLIAAIVAAVIQVMGIVANPVDFSSAPNFVMGRFVALVLVPVFFGLLGVVLVRHADDRPTPYLRSRRRLGRRR